jgi:hypothetical protein
LGFLRAIKICSQEHNPYQFDICLASCKPAKQEARQMSNGRKEKGKAVVVSVSSWDCLLRVEVGYLLAAPFEC